MEEGWKEGMYEGGCWSCVEGGGGGGRRCGGVVGLGVGVGRLRWRRGVRGGRKGGFEAEFGADAACCKGVGVGEVGGYVWEGEVEVEAAKGEGVEDVDVVLFEEFVGEVLEGGC